MARSTAARRLFRAWLHRLQRTLAAVEEIAAGRFDERDVVAAMRRVLTVELARRR
jgi:hypothetical protein